MSNLCFVIYQIILDTVIGKVCSTVQFTVTSDFKHHTEFYYITANVTGVLTSPSLRSVDGNADTAVEARI